MKSKQQRNTILLALDVEEPIHFLSSKLKIICHQFNFVQYHEETKLKSIF